MSIVNPYTGRAMSSTPGATARKMSDEDLMKILTGMRLQIETLSQQSMQLGLYVEFILEHLMQLETPEGEPLLEIDIEEFPAFAQKRLEEIKQELTAAQAAAATAEAEVVTALNSIPEQSVNLDE